MISQYHGLDVTLADLRRKSPISARGASLRTIIGTASDIGMSSRPVRVPLNKLENLQLPAMLHWDMNHFVVLEKVGRKGLLIHDPATRSYWLPEAEASAHFTGVAVEFTPSGNFATAPKPERLRISYLWQNASGIRRTILQLLLLSCVAQVYTLAFPYFMQIAIDRVLPNQDDDLLVALAVGFLLLLVFYTTASFLRSAVLLYSGSKLGHDLAVNAARKLLKLPIEYFEKRHTGDILARFHAVKPVQSALTEGALSSIVDGLLAILTFMMMVIYSPALTMIAVSALVAYCSARLLLYGPEREAQETAIIERSREQTMMIESLRGIVTLRLFNHEHPRHAIWQVRLANAINADLRSARIGLWHEAFNKLIFGIESIVTIYLSIKLIIEASGLSVGMLFAYMAYKSQFLEKARALIEQVIFFKMLSLHLERLSDIALHVEDRKFAEANKAIEGDLEIIGSVKIKNLSYRYSMSDPLILDQLDLKIEAGEHVAITGVSGTGKSTLLKIVLGLVAPSEGSILIDGRPLHQLGYQNYHRQISAVLPDDGLFGGSLAENIAFFDENFSMEEVEAAADQAAIHAEISAMPMGYDTLVGDMGSSLSGGQRQRVLLARALYRKPKILVLDEGTSHLDAGNEKRVSETIHRLGITRIVVAHRSETLRLADRTLLLAGGRLHER